jgi:MarR family transcriptional regulator, 2-MHQ and catechol-resistance regulon repressor
MTKSEVATRVHVWLVMMKAMQAIGGYAIQGLERAGLGDSDFRVLEVLLHKGPLPVNVLGPRVNLTPGSISVAVDRLFAKGLVSRVESCTDRRVRIVALTAAGKALIEPVFREHAATIANVFGKLSETELRQLERQLKRVGKRAQSMFDQSRAPAKLLKAR